MTSSNGNILRVTGPLWGESTGHRCISLEKASNAKLWWFLDRRLNKRLGKRSRRLWFETPSRLLWRQCKDFLCEVVLLESCGAATYLVSGVKTQGVETCPLLPVSHRRRHFIDSPHFWVHKAYPILMIISTTSNINCNDVACVIEKNHRGVKGHEENGLRSL